MANKNKPTTTKPEGIIIHNGLLENVPPTDKPINRAIPITSVAMPRNRNIIGLTPANICWDDEFSLGRRIDTAEAAFPLWTLLPSSTCMRSVSGRRSPRTNCAVLLAVVTGGCGCRVCGNKPTCVTGGGASSTRVQRGHKTLLASRS